jgi:hypothetical protein
MSVAGAGAETLRSPSSRDRSPLFPPLARLAAAPRPLGARTPDPARPKGGDKALHVDITDGQKTLCSIAKEATLQLTIGRGARSEADWGRRRLARNVRPAVSHLILIEDSEGARRQVDGIGQTAVLRGRQGPSAHEVPVTLTRRSAISSPNSSSNSCACLRSSVSKPCVYQP